MSEIKLLKCPFCGIPLKLVGSKRRGNQHYLHGYNNNCILNGFGFIATDENIQHWNTRKPMENIVKRLEEYEDEAKQLGVSGMLADMLEVVKEEGGLNE